MSAEYFSKLDGFEALYDDRVAIGRAALADDPDAVAAIDNSQVVIKAALRELVERYRNLFVDESAPRGKDDALLLTRLEANIAMAAQQTLDAMRKLIRLRGRRSVNPIAAVRSRLLIRSVNKINSSLARRDAAAPLSVAVAVPEMLLAGRKPVKTSLIVIALVGLHRSVSHWPRWLDPSNFFRTDDIVFRGVEAANAAMAESPRRAMVLIGNHDASMYEGALCNRLSRQIGSQHHIVMARRGVYPIPPPVSPGDVVYVDEDDPKLFPVSEAVSRVQEFLEKNDVVSFGVYPEGMMAFTGAQMPLAAKEGAYIVARKLAITLHEQGVPVYLVEIVSNMLEHLTQPECTEATATITSIQKVPGERIAKGKPDEWLAQRRLQSEMLYNKLRGERMLDIRSGRRIPNAKTYEARGLLGVPSDESPSTFNRR